MWMCPCRLRKGGAGVREGIEIASGCGVEKRKRKREVMLAHKREGEDGRDIERRRMRYVLWP